MKKFITIAAGATALVAAAGAAAVYWFGFRPEITYYPNGGQKTYAERKFFKGNGEYKAFDEKGILTQKYNVKDGIREGRGEIYAGTASASFGYTGGKLAGDLKLDTQGKIPELENLRINFNNGTFTLERAAAGSKKSEDENAADDTAFDPQIRISGNLACGDDEFPGNLQAFLADQTAENFSKLAGCLPVTASDAEDENYKCNFKGAYKYPDFTADSEFVCETKSEAANTLSAKYLGLGLSDTGKFSFVVNYSAKDKKFISRVFDEKHSYEQEQEFTGIDKMATAAAELAFSKQESQDLVKFFSTVLKNLTFGSNELKINGKIVSAVNGSFNFTDGFSNPWTISFFNAPDVLTSQIKINADGAVLNVAYPVSQKPMLSAGVQINDKFKQMYKSFTELVMKEFSENSEDVAAAHIEAKLPQYSMLFSDVINSVNALLMNNKGEKVIGAVLNVKQGMDFMTAMNDLPGAFDIKIISYKDNKPHKVISGDMKNGFLADGKVISAEEIPEHLDQAALDEVFAQIESEYDAVFKNTDENDFYSADPFAQGFYSGYKSYNESVKEGQAEQTVTDLMLLAQNIRKAYADTENYSGLDNNVAINLKTLPAGMTADKSGGIKGASGITAIKIYPSAILNGKDGSFVLEISGADADLCRNMVMTMTARYDGGNAAADAGLMGIGVNNNLNNLYQNEIEIAGKDLQTPKTNATENKCFEEGVTCFLGRDDLASLHKCSGPENTLYFKFR